MIFKEMNIKNILLILINYKVENIYETNRTEF